MNEIRAPRDFRKEVRAFLHVLDRGLGRGGSPESPETAVSLAKLWFEEIYLPGTSYLDSIKGDFAQSAAAQFNEAFAPDELELLGRFHRFFELRIELARKSPEGLEGIQSTPLWEHIRKDAGNTLALLRERLESS